MASASAAALLTLRTSHLLCRPYPFSSSVSTKGRTVSIIKMQAGSEITEEMSTTMTEGRPKKKKVFVAGATGSTGKRIVDQLLANGFAVKAGVRDLDKAKSSFPADIPSLELRLEQLGFSRANMFSQPQTPRATSAHPGMTSNCLASKSFWIVDSGATDHMTGNKSLLSRLAPTTQPPVQIANGSTCKVEGIGSAQISPHMSLSSVLYVPSFPENLMSVTKLIDQLYCSVTFTSTKCVFQELGTNKLIGTAYKYNGLYYMESSPQRVAYKSTSSAQEVHYQLGHPSLQVKADVTDGTEKLAEAIGDDSEAVVCATGFRPGWDLLAPWKVDNFGTVNLVEACRKRGVERFLLISSILVNGAAMGQILNPAYIFLNVFGLTLVAKLQAEQHIRKSGINYTIIRPGGLRNDPPSGNIVMEPEDTLYEGSISRDQVAQVAVEALIHPESSSYKVVEIVARPNAPSRSVEELFASIKQQ